MLVERRCAHTCDLSPCTYLSHVMEKNILLSLWLVPFGAYLPQQAQAQNLVIDPGFEEYSECPDGASQIDRCLHWSTPNKATTDLYTACSPAFASHVPFNMAGKQWPHGGNAYAGIV